MTKEKKTPVVDTKYFRSAKEALEEKKDNGTLSIGPALDEKTGGGIPDGSIVLLRTLSGVGKTTLAMQIAKNALDQNRYVMYGDVEYRGGTKKFFDIKGFDVNHPRFIYMSSRPNEPMMSGEHLYKNIKNMMSLPKYKGAVYIIDSFSKVTPQETIDDDEIKANRRDLTPKLNADFCKKIGNLVRASSSIVVGIQHFITNTSGYGDQIQPDGGIKLDYDSDIVFDARHKPYNWEGERINQKTGDKLPGQMIKFQLTKNKVLSPWISKEFPIECYIKFGEGIWWAKEAVNLLREIGYISGGGAWNTVTVGTEEFRIQGKEKLIDFVEENRSVLEPLIKDYFKTTYGANYDIRYDDNSEESEQCEEKSKKNKK